MSLPFPFPTRTPAEQARGDLLEKFMVKFNEVPHLTAGMTLERQTQLMRKALADGKIPDELTLAAGPSEPRID